MSVGGLDDDLTVEESDAAPQEIDVVTCSSCGHTAEIMVHPVEGHEQRWKCNCRATRQLQGDVYVSTKEDGDPECECDADNIIEGAPGEPGEGTLNPAATAVTDDQLLEAAVRRGIIPTENLTEVQKGIIHQLYLGGSAMPAGEAKGKKV